MCDLAYDDWKAVDDLLGDLEEEVEARDELA